MQRHPGHTPDTKEAASFAPSHAAQHGLHTRKRNQLLDLTHTHTHTTCWSKWRGSWWSKSRQGWRNLQVTCWFKWTVLHEQVVSVLKDPNESLYCWWTHKATSMLSSWNHITADQTQVVVTTDEVSRVSQITPLVDPSTFKSRPLVDSITSFVDPSNPVTAV